ncbi:MAG: HAD family hydrolase [Verrucomicrobiales bacterium]|nr:HAD family hydrolase [Verrucomicrobiales bacterium]
MNDPSLPLRNFAPTRGFFVGIDSDGCVFDTMTIKHKECFVPMFVKHFGLQPVARFAREVWEFVNLDSKTRGINRYPALSNALNLLAARPEVQARGVAVPSSDDLDDWMAREPRHTQAALRAEVERSGNETLRTVLDWSLAVDAQILDIVHGIPPFPGVAETLARLRDQADVMVISQTPGAALAREWAEHGLSDSVALVAGQEMGTKKDHLRLAARTKYPPNRVLMIGDAPGDFTAAKSNGALFFPILPGYEEASWKRLMDEALDAFFSEQYAGDFETFLVREFMALLPENPPWLSGTSVA